MKKEDSIETANQTEGKDIETPKKLVRQQEDEKMERLTERTDDGISLVKELHIHTSTTKDFENLQIVLKKLADYEDTGRTPETIQELAGCYRAVCRAHKVNVR